MASLSRPWVESYQESFFPDPTQNSNLIEFYTARQLNSFFVHELHHLFNINNSTPAYLRVALN